jgi:hypothetical protein
VRGWSWDNFKVLAAVEATGRGRGEGGSPEFEAATGWRGEGGRHGRGG